MAPPSPAVNHLGRISICAYKSGAPRKFIRTDWDHFQLVDESVDDEVRTGAEFQQGQDRGCSPAEKQDQSGDRVSSAEDRGSGKPGV